ncbi:RNA 2',3'-cyclic phosphodiesterase [Corynebacterium breve]|uniref:RNA 2',3'-cyclic phosphodiesterase n=1 Tax=Corynebacterium breve TaxID=3049799 RepID=A0ABY8VFT3_9CORY|nr:RNA 2',3'-cyclic phosphodiesterase [Corynebacterium breve]WIM67128.1 RNA 2',3'-cyclic phosphodiesterase [Corynebacterium breve]
MSRRLFAALTPSEPAREHLITALRPIRERDCNQLRFTEPDNWHITCAFYGETAEDPEWLLGHLAAASTGPLELCLSGAGSFSSRTLWIGVGGMRDRLRTLMSGCVLDPEEAARQRAHLTVARAHPRLSDPWLLGDITHALSVYRGPSWQATTIGLYESFLGQGRSGQPRYELLGTTEL